MLQADLLEKIIQHFIQNIRRGKITRIAKLAQETLKILREVLLSFRSKTDTFLELLSVVKNTGIVLTRYFPTVYVIGNTVRRVLFIIREEIYTELHGGVQPDEVYHKFNLDDYFIDKKDDKDVSSNLKGGNVSLTSTQKKDIKLRIINEVNDLLDDMENSLKYIANESVNLIHENEVILTLGFSHTVFAFLEKAQKKKIKFKVIVTEHAPSLTGHVGAEKYSELGIETILIPDSAIFAVMSRVNKVVVGTRALMANGGLIAESGAHIVAMAAKKHGVPLVICAALYKLTPKYPSEKSFLKETGNPNKVLDCINAKNVRVINPAFDYIPPELVSLFVTNDGVHNPSYIYRLLAEYYDPKDYDWGT